MSEEINRGVEIEEKEVVIQKPKKISENRFFKYGLIAIVILALSMGGGYLGATIANQQGSGTAPKIIKTSATDKPTSDIATIAKAASDTVVEISTSSVSRGNFMEQYVSEGAGSGVILTTDGYIITNNHVIEGSNSIKVRTKAGKEYDAILVGADSNTDIAVIKIEATGLSVAAIGDSSKIEVGESVVAIGNPLGSLGGSVTEGIISATSRTITIDNVDMTLLQTSAAINPGNSGGGLFNTSGELIGIVNAKSSGENIEGLGFSIPINTAIDVAQQIMKSGFSEGNYTLGIRMTNIENEAMAKQYGVEESGIYIYEVVSGSDADKLGLKDGDKLVSVNGKKITSFDDATSQIKVAKKDDQIKIIVKRDGKEKTFNLKV